MRVAAVTTARRAASESVSSVAAAAAALLHQRGGSAGLGRQGLPASPSSLGGGRLKTPSLHRWRPWRGIASAAPPTTAPDAPTTTTSTPPPPSFKAAIDFKALKAGLPAAVANVAARKANADPVAVVALYDAWRAASEAVNAARADRNANAAAMKGKLDAEQRAALVAAGKALKEQLVVLEAAAEDAEHALQAAAQRLPNLADPAVPVGGEEDAVVIKTVGSPPAFDGFSPVDHLAIGSALDLIDFDSGAAAAGAKFVYLRRAAAQLELALCTWALGKAAAAGFIPMTTPDLVKESVLEKCGFQPRADNTQVYGVRESGLCLTGTAEVPLAAVAMDKVLPAAALPLRMAAFGHCFRTEAGAAGSASRGLYRVHQFSKVELFVVATPDQSAAILDELLAFEEALFAELGLHYQVLDMPTGDLGAPAARKYDVEAWMPGLGRFGEVSSASNCTDYQARRLNIRFRPDSTGKPEFCHTLNATAAAVPRLVVAILETFQQADGSVVVPPMLRPFMGGLEVIRAPG